MFDKDTNMFGLQLPETSKYHHVHDFIKNISIKFGIQVDMVELLVLQSVSISSCFLHHCVKNVRALLSDLKNHINFYQDPKPAGLSSQQNLWVDTMSRAVYLQMLNYHGLVLPD